MPTHTIPWDSAEHLNTDEEVQAYLEACFEAAALRVVRLPIKIITLNPALG